VDNFEIVLPTSVVHSTTREISAQIPSACHIDSFSEIVGRRLRFFDFVVIFVLTQPKISRIVERLSAVI
jgi:hypothetical protein